MSMKISTGSSSNGFSSSSSTPATPAAAAAGAGPSGVHDHFLNVLKNDTGRAALYAFLQTCFSEHHLAFWQEVQLYKEMWMIPEEFAGAAATRYIHVNTAPTANPSSASTWPSAAFSSSASSSSSSSSTSSFASNPSTSSSQRLPANLLSSPSSAILEKSTRIYNEFIRNGSRSQINLTEQQRVRVKDRLEKSITFTLFDEAEQTALDLIKGNYYWKFTKSEQYQEWQLKETKKKKEKHSSVCHIL